MPLAGIDRVVINLLRRAEGQAAVDTADKHHVGCAPTGWHDAGQHVNVVVRRSAGLIDCQEALAIQSIWIDSPTTKEATHFNRRASVKAWRLARDLRITRPFA